VAGKKERQRKLARERMLRQQARRARRAQRARQASIIVVVCLVVVGLGVGGFFLFSQPTPSKNAATSATSSASPSPSATASAPPVAEPAHSCTYVTSGTAARKVAKPPQRPDWQASYQATIRTNRGDVVIKLLNSKATCTVNSFVSLASQHYFSSTPCHRLTTSGIFVLQCGDPTGTGSGGPGYGFASENLAGARYTAGTVAMANSGQPDSNGSQFFLVYKNSTTLPADYTPFGTVVKGLGIIQNVAKAGITGASGPGDGHPKEKVDIESVTITKT
jgi:peptidyl-prolyl cis-trans isomerase B (cyclophilin B)